MKGYKRYWFFLLLGAGGGGAGYVIGLAWEHYLTKDKPLLLAVVGAVIGLLCLPIYHWLVSGGQELQLESFEVAVPVIGTKVKVKVNDAHRVVGWKIFVESATRITTQPLESGEGCLREALTSMYKFFDIARTELKNMGPSPLPVNTDEYSVESYAVRMLNDGLRQLLSRWHPILTRWEATKRPESEWPLAGTCRDELEITQQKMLAYTWGIGEMLKVGNLDGLLPAKPAQDPPALLEADDVRALEARTIPKLTDSERVAGWHIFVELRSRIATEPLSPDSGLLSEALSSLKALFDDLRAELKQICPELKSATGAPATSGAPPPAETVQTLALSVLNKHLRPFLAKWHPLVIAWEKENPTAAESEWPENGACREQLELLRGSIAAEAKKLGELIDVSPDDFS